jgi:Ca2+-binding RTX toxin-like protein
MYGGIHWNFDNNVGLDAGNAIGQYVMANFLRPVEREAAAGVVNGELIVVGTGGGDVLSIARSGSSLVVSANGEVLGQFDMALAGIVVDAGAGNDLVLISYQVNTNAEIYAGAGNDLISGGSGDDRIFGEDGHDVILGNLGNDRLDGGAGNDVLFGGLGNDELLGGLGDDWLFGGLGLDLLDGGPGNNHLFQ